MRGQTDEAQRAFTAGEKEPAFTVGSQGDWRVTAPGVVGVDVILESALLERDLSRYDCIFLCNVAQFTASEAQVLRNVLSRGGGVVFFLGDQVLADRYNRELAGDDATRVLPATLGEVVADARRRTGPGFEQHAIRRIELK